MSDYICMEVTVAQAAARLGVSARQVQRLAREGRLQVVRQVGRTLLLDDSGVRALERRARQPGRIWGQKTAWAAIDLLTDGATERIRGSALSRLRRDLGGMSAEGLVRLSAGRATTRRFEQLTGDPAELSGYLTVTGQSALADAHVAARFGLVAGAATRVEGYVHEDHLTALREEFGLNESGEGEVLLHITQEQTRASALATALDLYDYGATRDRAAARSVIAAALGQA